MRLGDDDDRPSVERDESSATEVPDAPGHVSAPAPRRDHDVTVETGPRERIRTEVDHLRAEVDEIRAEVDRQRARFRRKRAEINERSGRNLAGAIGIGVVLGAAVLASLLFVKQLFILFGLAMVALVVVELASAMRSSGRDVPRIPSVAVAIVVVPVAYYFGPAWQWIALLGGIAFIAVWRLVEASIASPRPSRAAVWADLLAGAFIQIYVTFLGSFTVMLTAQEHGEFWVLGFIIVVISIDTGAYVFGINFGRHKLAPRISPGKTWEGFAGATLTALVVSVIVAITLLQQPWWFGLVLAPLLVVTATAGDLTESMIKRDLGIKDMSSWLPGHGGFFDRLDSILPSGAIAFALYFWTAELAPAAVAHVAP